MGMFEQQKAQGAKNIVFGKKDADDNHPNPKKLSTELKIGSEERVG